MTELQAPDNPKISRRNFLKLAGLGAGAITLDSFLAHMPFAPSLTKTFWEQLETATLGVPTEQLRKSVEDKFQVEIVGPSTGVKKVESFETWKTVEWDNPRLKDLIGALSQLPPHFYQPRMIEDQYYKIRFALTHPDITKQYFMHVIKGGTPGGACLCPSADKQTVTIDKSPSGFLFGGSTRRAWIHEITHALTDTEMQRYIQNVCEPLGIKTVDDLRELFLSKFELKKTNLEGIFLKKHHIDELIKEGGSKVLVGDPGTRRELIFLGGDRIAVAKSDLALLGEKYIKDELLKYIRSARWTDSLEDYLANPPDLSKTQIRRITIEGMELELNSIALKNNIAYGADSFNEFFSVAAEYYVKGRNNFIKTYEPFLDRERAEKLYERLKQEIFRGKEY